MSGQNCGSETSTPRGQTYGIGVLGVRSAVLLGGHLLFEDAGRRAWFASVCSAVWLGWGSGFASRGRGKADEDVGAYRCGRGWVVVVVLVVVVVVVDELVVVGVVLGAGVFHVKLSRSPATLTSGAGAELASDFRRHAFGPTALTLVQVGPLAVWACRRKVRAHSAAAMSAMRCVLVVMLRTTPPARLCCARRDQLTVLTRTRV